jgi:hypothetical protein
MNIKLTYDEDTILKIDDIISNAWSNIPSSKTIQIWGCFLGESIRKILGGSWIETEAGLGVIIKNIVIHPLNKIEKRFIQGTSESISFFYKVIKEELICKNITEKSPE